MWKYELLFSNIYNKRDIYNSIIFIKFDINLTLVRNKAKSYFVKTAYFFLSRLSYSSFTQF